MPVWDESGSNQITLCDTRHNHHILLNLLSAINMINKHSLECERNIFSQADLAFFGCLALVPRPCCEQSEAVPSQDCGWVPRNKSRQTAAYSWKEGMQRVGEGGDGCRSRLWYRLNVWKAPSILETVWHSSASHGECIRLRTILAERLSGTRGGWKLPGSLTLLHDLAPGFLGSFVLDLRLCITWTEEVPGSCIKPVKQGEGSVEGGRELCRES